MLGSKYIYNQYIKNYVQNSKRKTIYLGKQINFDPFPSIYLHTIVLILNDSSLFIQVIPSKSLLNNILKASCSVQYKPQSYKTEPHRGKKKKVCNSKTSFNKFLSITQYIQQGEPDLGKDKKIYVSTHYSKVIFLSSYNMQSHLLYRI